MLKQNNDNLNNIQNKFTNLEKQYKQEKNNREENQKEIKTNINKNVKEINTKLESENKSIKIFKENFMNELDKRDKSLADLQNKNTNDLKMLKEEVYAELENRFDHQNQIVNNISIFMKSFQEALSIMGKDF